MIGGLVDGIVLGSIITLGSLGLTYVLLLQNYFNFTAGSYLTLGAYYGLTFLAVLPSMGPLPLVNVGVEFLVAAVLSMLGLGITMCLVDQALFRPLRERNAAFMIFYLTSFGLVFVVRSLVRLIWGPQRQSYTIGVASTIELMQGVRLTPEEIVVVFTSFVVVAGVYYFQYHTRLGAAMRAMASNESLARVTGIRSEHMHMLVTFLAGMLTALGGLLYGLVVQLRPLMGFNLLLAMFVAVVCGGEGAILGTLGAGLIVGVSQEFGAQLLQPGLDALNVPVELTAYKQALTFLLMIAVMYFKPRGIFEGTFLER